MPRLPSGTPSSSNNSKGLRPASSYGPIPVVAMGCPCKRDWLARQLQLDEIRDALDAENMLAVAPFVVPADARAFAWYLLDAGGQRYVGRSVGVIAARQRLQRISEAAFRRYLIRVRAPGGFCQLSDLRRSRRVPIKGSGAK